MAVLLGSGCASMQARPAQDEDRLTVARAQAELRIGMSGGEVIDAIGSPNIISTDDNGWEVWVYDRVATDVTYTRKAGFISGLLVFGSGGGVGGLGSAGGSSASTQRTLTIVVKFDGNQQVRDLAYHATRF